MNTLQEKVKKLIAHITANYVAEVPRNIYDPERSANAGSIGNKNFIPVTTALLLINTLLGNNTLIEGAAGTSKTQLAAVAGSLLFGVPYEMYERRRVIGADGCSVNEIYATHDLAELNRGNDIAFLYLPFYMPFVIIDELNRYGPLVQNIIREGIAANVWNYTNHSWLIKDQIVVSAINPDKYGGTYELNENLVDNYSLTLEPPYYNSLLHQDLIQRSCANIRRDLGCEAEVNKLNDFYASNKNDPPAIQRHIEGMRAACFSEYKKRGLPVLSEDEKASINKEIRAVEFSDEANLFIYSLMSEITYTRKFGRLRIDDPASDDSHDRSYISAMLKESMAGRFFKDLHLIARSIAWYFGKTTADIEEIRAAFIYVAARRIKPFEKSLHDLTINNRMLPCNFKIAKEVVNKAWKNYSGFTNSTNLCLKFIRKALVILNEKIGAAGNGINYFNLCLLYTSEAETVYSCQMWLSI